MNEEQVQVLFQGIDDGLGDLITTLQNEHAQFAQTLEQTDFSNVASGGQAYQTLAAGIHEASSAQAEFAAAAGTAGSATADATSAATLAAEAQRGYTQAAETTAQALSQEAAASAAAGEAHNRGAHEIKGMKVEADSLVESVRELAGKSLPGLNTAISTATAGLSSMRASSEEDVHTLATMGAGLAAVGVVAAAVTFEGFIEGTEHLHQLALQSGMTEAQVAGLQTAFEAVGVSSDRMGSMVMIASRNLETMQDQVDAGTVPSGRFAGALEKLGVDALDSSGNVRSFGDLMPMIADKFRELSEHAKANGETFNAAGLAVQLFGRSGSQLVPMLLEGSAAFKEYTDRANQLGVGSAEQVKQLEAWKKAQAELHLEIQGFVATVGSAVAPVLIAFVSGIKQGLEAVNSLPGPVRELVIILPLFAGGLMLVTAGFQAASSAATMFVGSVMPMLGIAAPLALVVVAVGLHAQAFSKAEAAGDAYAASVAKVIQGLREEGVGHDEITAKLNAEIKAREADLEAARAKLNDTKSSAGGFFSELFSNPFGAYGSDPYSQQSTKVHELEQVLKDLHKQLGDVDSAEKTVGDSASGASAKFQQQVDALDKVGMASQSVVTYTKQVDEIAKQAASSNDARIATEHALADAVAITALGSKERGDREKELDNVIKNGSDSQKAYAGLVKELIPVLGTLTQGQVESKIAQEEVNKALEDARASGRDATLTLNEIGQLLRDGKIDADKYAQALSDLFSKPTKEELVLRQQIDANRIALSQWDATLQNSSPIDQHIASLVKHIEQMQREGASSEDVQKAQEELNRQLAAVPAAEGAAIVARQHQADTLTIQTGQLQANLGVLQNQRTASKDAAEAASSHALSIDQVTGAANPATGAITAVAQQTQAAGGAAATAHGQTGDYATAMDTAQKNAALLASAATGAVTGIAGSGGAAASAAGQVDAYTTSINSATAAVKVFNSITPLFGTPGGSPLTPGSVSFPGTGSMGPGGPAVPEYARGDRQAMIQALGPLAQYWQQQTGFPASYLLAMNISESNAGLAPGNELFGIKGSGTAGSSNLATHEDMPGGTININDSFGAYNTPQEAYADFFKQASTGPGNRYAGAWQRFQQDHNPDEFLQSINQSGWATDQTWASKIKDIATNQVAPSLQPLTEAVTGNTAALATNTTATASLGATVAPIAGAAITQGFLQTGMQGEPLHNGVPTHEGVDFDAAQGTAIHAITGGKIIKLGTDPNTGLGLYITMEGPGGIQETYGHAMQQNVAVGQTVNAGDVLGLVGSTGFSTGPHLHVEAISAQGTLLDPNALIAGQIKDSGVQNLTGSGAFVNAGALTGALGTTGQLPVAAASKAETLNENGLTAAQQHLWDEARNRAKELAGLDDALTDVGAQFDKAVQGVIDKPPVTAESLKAETDAHGPLVEAMTAAYNSYNQAVAHYRDLLQSGTAKPNDLALAKDAMDEAKKHFDTTAHAVSASNQQIAADTKAWHDDQVSSINDLGKALETAYKAMYKQELDDTKTHIAEMQKQDEEYVTALKHYYDQRKQASDDALQLQQRTAQEALRVQQRSMQDAFTDQQRAESESLQRETQYQNERLALVQRGQDEALQVQQKSASRSLDEQTKSQIKVLQSELASETANLYASTGQTVSAQMALESGAAASVRARQEGELQTKIGEATGSAQKQLQGQLASMQAEDRAATINAQIQQVQDAAKLQQDALQQRATRETDALHARQKQEQDALQSQQKSQQDALQQSQRSQSEALQDNFKAAGDAQADWFKNAKKTSDTYWDGLKTQADTWLAQQKTGYKNDLDAAQHHYNDLTSAASLSAKVRFDLENGNQAQIVAMLSKYNPDWQAAGANYGKALIDGLQAAKIPDQVAAIFAKAGIKLDPNSAVAMDTDFHALGVASDTTAAVSRSAEAGFSQAKTTIFGPNSINVTVYGSTLTEDDVRDAVFKGLGDAVGRDANLSGANP